MICGDLDKLYDELMSYIIIILMKIPRPVNLINKLESQLNTNTGSFPLRIPQLGKKQAINSSSFPSSLKKTQISFLLPMNQISAAGKKF